MTWLIPGLMAIYAVRIVWLARRAVQGQRLRVIRAGAAKLLLVYLGIAIVLSFLANWFLYHPSRQMSRWEAQDENKIEEVWLTSEDGTRLHAFWYPLASVCASGSDHDNRVALVR